MPVEKKNFVQKKNFVIKPSVKRKFLAGTKLKQISRFYFMIYQNTV
jgi:hypothetical protein